MNRRDFIISLTMTVLGHRLGTVHAFSDNMTGAKTGPALLETDSTNNGRIKITQIVNEKDACPVPQNLGEMVRGDAIKPADQSGCLAPLGETTPHLQADRYRQKMHLFNAAHPDDRYVSKKEQPLLKNCIKRLKRIYRTVGHTNFYLLGFDDALKLARGYHRIGRFMPDEIRFLESIFHQDAVSYGFYGKKQIPEFTHQIPKKEVNRIPRSGNFLYKGPAVSLYQRLHRDIGPQAILTSGVRGVIKQSYLFLNKVHSNQGNLSLASRSIAPPGYSYHGIGDFDVGQIGLGPDNFSARFIQSEVFKKLHSLDYICLRYTEDNPFGVRFEPWHVMVHLSG